MTDFLKNKDYLDRLGVDYKLNGSEAKLQYCPVCETASQHSKPYNLFHVNVDKGVYQCFHKNSCGDKGTLYGLMLKLGIIDPLTEATKRQFKVPPPRPELLSDVDKFYKWYEEERGIKKEILEKFKVGLHKQNGRKYITYQYIELLEGSEMVFNRKFRHCSDKKDMWTVKGAKQGYYGLQHVDFSKDTNLYVCEGEDDCHALTQYGLSNVVSVPFGANNYSIDMDKINSKAHCIVLFFDCDEKGQKGAHEFAKKAGLHKCINVILPFKDARECIANGVEDWKIFKAMSEGKQFKNEEVMKAGDYTDQLIDTLFGDGNLGVMVGSKVFNKITKGIRMSEMSILTGHSGSGKTTFGYNLVSWLLDKDIPCLCMSFENRMTAILPKLISIRSQQVVRDYDEEKNKIVLRMDEDTVRHYVAELNRLPLYFLNTEGADNGFYDIDKMEKIVEYSVKYYGVKFFLIDHLHYFLKLSHSRNPVQLQDECLRRIKQWTERLGVHIVLIVHPSQPKNSKGDQGKLDMYSGKGSSSIVQECDNYWIVYRGDAENEGEYFSIFEEHKNREHGLGTSNSIEYDILPNKTTFVGGKIVEKKCV